MNNNNEELWRAFGEEVGEQLDKLDMELTKGTAACDIHQVFRDFHTIKSSCAMLDMDSMKELAHVSEDYLDLVRNNSRQLTEQSIDVLLLAVETLKRQLSTVMATRQNPASAVEIIADIQQLIGLPRASGERGQTISATARPDQLLAAAEQAAEQERRANLQQLAEDARPVLLALAQAQHLTPVLKNQLIHFGNMAQLLDFPLLQILCRDIVLAFPVALSATTPGSLLHHKVDLMDRMRHLEQEYQVDCGCGAAAVVFRSSVEKEFGHVVLALADMFADLDRQDLLLWLGTRHEPVENTLHKLALLAALCALPELRNVLNYMVQVIRSVRRGYFSPPAGFSVLLQQAIDHPYGDLLREGESFRAEALVQCRENLEQATRLPERSLQAHSVFTHNASGKTRCDIDIQMGNEVEVIEQLVEWISLHGNILNSTSAFDEGRGNSITFQVEFDLALNDVREKLHNIDRDALYFLVRECVQEKHSGAIERTSTETPAQQESFNAILDMPQLLGSTLRISSQAIDNLVTQVGEVVMARNMIGSLIQREQYEILSRKCRYLLEQVRSGLATAQQGEELKAGLLALMAVRDGLLGYDSHLQGAISQVQAKVLDLREMPVATVFSRLPNVVRKISHAMGKQVSLKTRGQEACIDKGMMDILLKTLATLLQQVIVQGPDTQALDVQARIQGNYLNIAITCHITSHSACYSVLAGQGAFVGIKKTLDRIGGILLVDNSQPGHTLVSLDFPRTVAMQTLLLTRSGNAITALPERNIVEIRRFKGASIQSLQGRASLAWRGDIIPVVNLDEWIHRSRHLPSRFAGDRGSLVIIGNGTQHMAVHVDEIMGLRDSFVPEIHTAFSAISHINGTTILGDGSVVFMLNVEHLMQSLYAALPGLFHRADHQVKAA